jgi:S1-C subfamily serine protease
MTRKLMTAAVLLGSMVLTSAATRAEDATRAQIKKLYDDVTPSLVAVQYTWEYEYGKADFVGAGVVVGADGVVIMPLTVMSPGIPDAQLVDFKIIIPHVDRDDEEIDATLEGRDERNQLVFVKAKESSEGGKKHEWRPVKFVASKDTLNVGDRVMSVGLMPKGAGYRSYFESGTVAARLRGELTQYLVTGGALAAMGSPVFNAKGEAIGYVPYQNGQQYLLHTSASGRRGGRGGGGEDGAGADTMYAVERPPRIFIPSEEILQSLNDPPKDGKSIVMPWIGTPQLAGVKKDVAEYLGIEGQPAVEIGDVVDGSPAAKGGLKVGMKILKVNDEPIERGDEPEELPDILRRKLSRMKPGDTVTFTVMTEPKQPTQDIKVTLEERPKRPNAAKRFWAEDLQFSAREVVWEDLYQRKQPPDTTGVVIGLIKPQGAAANAHLAMGDLVTQFNNEKVESLDQFEKDYKAFRQDKPKEAIVLVVMKSDATTQTLRIEPPQ